MVWLAILIYRPGDYSDNSNNALDSTSKFGYGYEFSFFSKLIKIIKKNVENWWMLIVYVWLSGIIFKI